MTFANSKNQQGFSLIELLVSLSLFTVVVTMSVGTLLVLIDANSKAQNIQITMTNLNFALDSMTREIRTGKNYFCSGGIPVDFISQNSVHDCHAGKSISFIEGGQSLTGSTTARIEYSFNSTAGQIQRRIAPDLNWYPVTSDDIHIDKMEFYLNGSAKPPNYVQPLLTIYISGTAGDFAGVDSRFHLQTSVTQRQFDI